MKAGLSELDIKATILKALQADRRITRATVLTSEYVLGRLPCRADLAAWNGRDFIGIEVKSARDNLLRLPAQLTYYRACFDRVVIVADEKHIGGVLDLTWPSDEVWKIDRKGSLTRVQGGTVRPPTATDNRSRLQLLKLPQLKALVGNTDTLTRRSRLLERAQSAPASAVKDALVNSFCNAYGKSSADFWRAIGRRVISRSHIELLSPFAAERRRVADSQREAQMFWERWNAQADEVFGSYEPFNPPNQSPLRQPMERLFAHADGC